MAEVSFLHFPEDDHDLFLDDFSPLDSFSYWPHHHVSAPTSHDLSVEIGTPNGAVSTLERKYQVNFVVDLFHQRVEESSLMGNHEIVLNNVNDSSFRVSGDNRDLEIELGFVEESNMMGSGEIVLSNVNDSTFRVIEENYDVGPHDLDLDLGFLGQEHGNVGCNVMGTDEIVSNNVNDSSFRVIEENHDVGVHPLEVELVVGLVDQEHGNNNNHNHDNDEEDCNFGGFAVSECGDDFYIARRRGNGSGNCERVSGVRDVWIESDSDDGVEGIGDVVLGMHLHSDEEEEDFSLDNVNDDGDISIPLCWDSFHLDEEDDHGEVNHDFEWEEVDDGVDERDVLSFMADPEDEEEDGERGSRVSNLEWEVLLNHIYVNNLGRNPEMENEAGPYFGDHDDDYIYTTDYEMMFGQFADGENAILGKPPASKSVVEKLPSVVITKEDVADEKSLCAVCKDQIEVGDEGKELPCFHRYHGDCIVPWLEIRNTCPVCRFELPTDDPDYEQRRARRSAHAG